MRLSARVDINETPYLLDLSNGTDISLPVRFDGLSFRAFGAKPASCQPYEAGEQALAVERGAGCNCPVFTFSAHLHGTHTECVGHITRHPYIVQELAGCLGWQTALLISVLPEAITDGRESYQPQLAPEDRLITREALEACIGTVRPDALVMRTVPNDRSKLTRDYGEEAPPFFSNDAMAFVCELGVKSLLVDLPSVDRLSDEGMLSNHHIFWGVEQGSHQVSEPSRKTITELIYVPDELADGLYALDLSVSNILSDAAPSRPILYRLEPA
jgi:hypothetical protein